jgi:hypothetical protein
MLYLCVGFPHTYVNLPEHDCLFLDLLPCLRSHLQLGIPSTWIIVNPN